MDNTPLVNNSEGLFPSAPTQQQYPAPQPTYPQPAYGQQVYAQPAYGQQVYAQPAYGQPQGIVMTNELKDFFGYVKFIKIISIIYMVTMIITIFPLVMIWYAIIGFNVSKKWNESSFGCFYCVTMFNFISDCLLCGYFLVLCFTGAEVDGQIVDGMHFVSSFVSQLVSCLLLYVIVRASNGVKKGLYKYQIHDVMTKAAYTKLYLENDVPCKCW